MVRPELLRDGLVGDSPQPQLQVFLFLYSEGDSPLLRELEFILEASCAYLLCLSPGFLS